jgi:hypothetical protein
VTSEPPTLPYTWIGRKPTTDFMALTEDLTNIIVDDEDLGMVIVDEDLRIIIVDQGFHLMILPGISRTSRLPDPFAVALTCGFERWCEGPVA